MRTKIHTSTLEALADKHNLEVFHCPKDYALGKRADVWDGCGECPHYEDGWYWWPCFPGCLPDGDAIGPFKTYREALLDAVSVYLD